MRRAPAAILIFLLGGCVLPPDSPQASPTPSPLTIEVLYPDSDTALEMGQPLRAIVRLAADDGTPVVTARVTARVLDPAGVAGLEVEGEGDGSGVYRTPRWTIPHRSLAGPWEIVFTAEADGAAGEVVAPFRVEPSTSETLLDRYGFWIDEPALSGIDPFIAGEFGNAADGRILWGGVVPAVHILPAAWLEIQWRQGSPPLVTEEDVRRFLLEDLGQFGVSKTRALGPVTRMRFQDWPAWRVAARGEFLHEQVEWVVFYSPEVDRTFAIGTTVVLPPPGIDAPAELRRSFRVSAEESSDGVAPAPLPDLQPAPELIAPPLGTGFIGPQEPVTISWSWFRPLQPDEAFDVRLDYNYQESNRSQGFTTRANRLTLPLSLYESPNCGVFNWRVRVVRPEAANEPVSYESLYAYLLWSHPPAETPPFLPLCPNEQY